MSVIGPGALAAALGHQLRRGVFRAVTVHGTLERRLGVVGVRRILQQIDVQAAVQAMPDGRKPVRGAWRKAAKGGGGRPESTAPALPPRDGRPGSPDRCDGPGEDSIEAASVDAAVLALADADWLRHTLILSGPAAEVAAFRARARGPSAIPWHLDLDHEEMRLLAPMASAGPAARGLARELRAQLAAHQERVLAAAAHPGDGCPLDLHRLLPVPSRLLMLGSDAPESRLWLCTQWGTLQPLRHVRVLEHVADAWLKRVARVVWEFWSADWTPWRAIVRLRQDWPSLMFDVRPHYEDGASG